jgi:hypothetical protein
MEQQYEAPATTPRRRGSHNAEYEEKYNQELKVIDRYSAAATQTRNCCACFTAETKDRIRKRDVTNPPEKFAGA